MVDAMPEGGRDLEKLREVSRRTGIHIVAATGLHTEKYYRDPFLVTLDPPQAVPTVTRKAVTRREGGDEALARRFIDDVAAGCGVIKAATGEAGMNARAHRLFEAVARAQSETGAPIITHCEDGKGALQQVEFFSTRGVPLNRVVMSHTDKVPDAGYHRSLLQSGVNLEYDQSIRQAGGEQSTAVLLARMIGEGYLGQLMLGTDGARRSLWTTLGGSPGLAYLAGQYESVMQGHGVGPLERGSLFVDNPARWLTFRRPEP